MADAAKVPSGVQQLISRLRDEGVRAGQEKADRILKEAEMRAAKIIAEAKAEAANILGKARSEIEKERAAAHDSLRVAMRDTELKLEAEVKAAFSSHLRRLVCVELRDKDFLRQVILAVAGVVTGDKVCAGQPAEMLLPRDLFVSDEKGTKLTEEGRERMRHFVLGISGEMLREGVDLKPSDDISGGIRVRLVGEDLEIDLSDKALSDLLLKNLLPRYRAIVAGIE
jgi:V/A-type H+-transporting ATPase subunit E